MGFDAYDDSSGSFVNPYTFVPFAKPSEWTSEHPWRMAPAGHDRLGVGRFSGLVEVEITAQSPLLLRNVVDGVDREAGEGRPGTGEVARFPRRVAGPGGEEQPFLPGSGIAGVVRSLHESIAGGCLRVFDGGFRPGYRDVAKPRTGYWYMARVDAVDGDGKPTSLTVCPQTTWVPATWLADVLGGWREVRTGATVRLLDVGRTVSFGRFMGKPVSRLQLSSPNDVVRGDGWVLLLTDSGTRKTGDNATYFCAVGKLGGSARSVEWAGEGEEVWEEFLDAVEGSDDLRRARKAGRSGQEETVTPWIDVVPHPARPHDRVGQRIAARRRLFAGQVVWVQLAERFQDGAASAALRVTQIALAQIWRHGGGRERSRDRVPEKELLPCQDVADGLCPTCRVFGSAETEGTDTAAATQKGYRGHVRFSDAVLPPGVPPPAMETHLLPPLSAPRPGAGQFYLRQPEGNALRDLKPMEEPQREWGSRLDGKALRMLRGRKWYWLTGRAERRPFFRATRERRDAFHALYEQPDGRTNELLSRAEAVPAGTRFRHNLRFENLTAAEIGGLLAALSPQDLLQVPDGHAGPLGFAVGGGRPLGFGTCTAEILRLEAHSARSRYAIGAGDEGREEREEPPTHDAALAAFRRSVPGDQRKRVWKALRHGLCLDRVEPHQVWYPPAGELSEDGPLVPEHLRSSMTFWKATRGFRHQGKEEDVLRPLPMLGAHEQALPVVPDRNAVRRGSIVRRGGKR